MKKIVQITNRLGFALLMGATLSLSACSTGTKDGDTNVERGSAKDAGLNDAAMKPENAATDSAAQADNPDANKTYQKVDPDNGTRDADNDGKADQ